MEAAMTMLANVLSNKIAKTAISGALAAWGQSNWTAGPSLSGTNNLFQTYSPRRRSCCIISAIDTFDEAGSFMAGLQGGYNCVWTRRASCLLV
jgi:hypothetical protein